MQSVLGRTSLTSAKGLQTFMPLTAVLLESSISKAAAAAEQTLVFSSLLLKKSITGGSIQNTVWDKHCVTVLAGTNIIYSIKLCVHICLWAGACQIILQSLPLYRPHLTHQIWYVGHHKFTIQLVTYANWICWWIQNSLQSEHTFTRESQSLNSPVVE